MSRLKDLDGDYWALVALALEQVAKRVDWLADQAWRRGKR